MWGRGTQLATPVLGSQVPQVGSRAPGPPWGGREQGCGLRQSPGWQVGGWT